MQQAREETPEAREHRLKWMHGADPNASLYCDVQGTTVFLGQPEKIDLRLNRMAIPIASLTLLLHQIVTTLTGQAVAAINTAPGGGNGPSKAS